MKKKVLSVLLIAVLCFGLCGFAAACGEETPDDPINPIDKTKDPYVQSVEILSQPTKTEYYAGEIFDPQGLEFNATWIIEGEEKVIKLGYGTCDGWTHKDEPLTADVEAITFTIGGFTFDVAITVESMDGLDLVVDRSTIRAEYTTADAINLTTVKVYVQQKDGTLTSALDPEKYSLYDGQTAIAVANRYAYALTEGEHTFRVSYLNIEKSFTVTVIDEAQAITPYHIQAETSTFLYQDGTDSTGDGTFVETDTRWSKTESTSWYARYPEGSTDATASQILRIAHGAEGSVISNIEKLTTYYIKFTVTVPTAGEYDLLVRAQATAATTIANSLKININGATEADGTTLAYTALATTDKILTGNQRYKTDGSYDSPSWFNMYFWTTAKLGTYTLQAGENVIRLQPTGNVVVPNLDYFEVQHAGTTSADSDVAVINERSGEGVVLGDEDAVYIAKGTKLGDITGIGAEYPDHYTLLYLRVYNYTDKNGNVAFLEEIPITEEMISGIDYDQVGVQTASVSYTTFAGVQYTATFTVNITN